MSELCGATGLRWPGGTEAVPLDRDISQLCDLGLVFSSRKSVCEVPQALSSLLQAEEVSLTLRKPGNGSIVVLTMQAMGEDPFDATVNITMTRFEARSASAVAANKPIRADEPSISAFGVHIKWQQLPPAPTWHTRLDGSSLKFVDTSRHEFTVRLACDRGEQSCASDGDVITTVVQLVGGIVAEGSLPSNLYSEVRVVVQVQSLVSCRHTRAGVHIEPNTESVPIATLIRVRLFAKDVDDLPISFTRAEISLGFGDHTIPMQWTRGSNQYVADVPAELAAQPGRYDLVVRANDAWNETGPAPSCELLRRTIIVQEGLSTTWILVGAAVAAVVVLGGLLVVVRKRHAHLQAIMLVVFTEVSAIQDH